MRVHRSFHTQSLTGKRTHTYLAYLCMYLFIYWLNYLLSVYWFVCLHVVVVCMLFIYLFCLHVVHLPIHSLIHHVSIHWFVHVHVPGVRAYTNAYLLVCLLYHLFTDHVCWSIRLLNYFLVYFWIYLLFMHVDPLLWSVDLLIHWFVRVHASPW